MLAGLGTSVLAILAIKGLKYWREQLHGTSKFDTATRLLPLIYECEERLRAIRIPFVTTQEMARIPQHPGETDEKHRKKAAYMAFGERAKDHIEEFAKLRAEAFRARAVFRDSIFEPLKIIIKEPYSLQILAQLALQKQTAADEMHRKLDAGQIEYAEFSRAFDEAESINEKLWASIRSKSLSEKSGLQ